MKSNKQLVKERKTFKTVQQHQQQKQLHTVRKEMKCSWDSEILHEIVLETTQISSCISDFHLVSRTISCSISESLSNSELCPYSEAQGGLGGHSLRGTDLTPAVCQEAESSYCSCCRVPRKLPIDFKNIGIGLGISPLNIVIRLEILYCIVVGFGLSTLVLKYCQHFRHSKSFFYESVSIKFQKGGLTSGHCCKNPVLPRTTVCLRACILLLCTT